MDILTFFTPAEMAGPKLTADTAIVVDVLLGTTTISAALKAGASKVITVSEVDEAIKFANELGREKTLIGGNRSIDETGGFDLGSSPGEYSLDKMAVLITCKPCSKAPVPLRYYIFYAPGKAGVFRWRMLSAQGCLSSIY